jgi:hypothetical protein
MKSKIRSLLAVVPTLTIAAGIFVMAAELRSVQSSGFTVHEWGTFTSVAGEDGAPVIWNALGCKSDLPGFVNDTGYRNFKFRLTGTVRMETPVMYFYSPRDVTASVKVQFPRGVITEWYPSGDNAIYESKRLMDQMGAATRSPFYSENAVYETKRLIDPPPSGLDPLMVKLSPSLNGIDTSLRNLMGAISWSNIKVQPGLSADFPQEKSPSRYYAARGTDAAPITVGEQHEKFLFYRGVGRFAVPLSVRVSGYGQVTVENRGHETVPELILFEKHEGRMGFRVAGPIVGTLALDEPAFDASFSQLRNALETALVAQGLFPKEARAMVETWRDSWFEEGSRLIYIVPSSAVDVILPLDVEPAPSQIARIFVGRIELVTPETKRAVESAIAKNDWATVDRYGRFLVPILNRIYAGNPLKIAQVEQFVAKFETSRGGACR